MGLSTPNPTPPPSSPAPVPLPVSGTMFIRNILVGLVAIIVLGVALYALSRVLVTQRAGNAVDNVRENVNDLSEEGGDVTVTVTPTPRDYNFVLTDTFNGVRTEIPFKITSNKELTVQESEVNPGAGTVGTRINITSPDATLTIESMTETFGSSVQEPVAIENKLGLNIHRITRTFQDTRFYQYVTGLQVTGTCQVGGGASNAAAPCVSAPVIRFDNNFAKVVTCRATEPLRCDELVSSIERR
jgi:hypothetical protein